ncbi:hypothetical protein BH23CHL6_BH23CHL6_06180 [soil metagenome]
MKLLSRSPRDNSRVPPWPQHAEAVSLLLIDDDEDEYTLLQRALRDIKGTRFDLDWVSTYAAGLQRIEKGGYDAYLVDYHLGERSGAELIREARAAACSDPMIMLTGQASREVDMEAMDAGATDFLEKGRTPPLLLERTIRYAITNATISAALRHRLRQVSGIESFGRLLSEIGPTPDALDELMRLLGEDFGFEQTSLYLMDGDILHLAAVRGYASPLSSIDRHSGRLSHVLDRGRAQEMANVTVDPEYRSANEPKELCVPLTAEGRCLGLLNIAWSDEMQSSEGTYEGVLVVADRLAVALALNRAIRGRSFIDAGGSEAAAET